MAHILDDLGYDLIGIQDHPYQSRHFDAMALAGYVLGATEKIRVFPDVANLPLRSPLMLAQEAATLDQLSGGRFELGLGAGAFWDAIRAMGGPVRTPGRRLERCARGYRSSAPPGPGRRSASTGITTRRWACAPGRYPRTRCSSGSA